MNIILILHLTFLPYIMNYGEKIIVFKVELPVIKYFSSMSSMERVTQKTFNI